MYYNNIKQTDNEIEAYIKALEISRSYDFSNEIKGGLMSNIGGILLNQNKYKEALEYFEASLNIVEDKIAKGGLHYHIGLVHKGEASYDTALSYFKQSYDYYREGQDIKGMALALIEEGKYYDHQQKFEKANQIYNQATVLI